MVLAAGTPQEGATGSVHSVTAFVVRLQRNLPTTWTPFTERTAWVFLGLTESEAPCYVAISAHILSYCVRCACE